MDESLDFWYCWFPNYNSADWADVRLQCNDENIVVFCKTKMFRELVLQRAQYSSVWPESKLKIFDGFWSVYGVPVSSTLSGGQPKIVILQDHQL